MEYNYFVVSEHDLMQKLQKPKRRLQNGYLSLLQRVVDI